MFEGTYSRYKGFVGVPILFLNAFLKENIGTYSVIHEQIMDYHLIINGF